MPQPHPLNPAADLLTLAAFVFMLYAAWRVHRRGEERNGLVIALTVVVLLAVSAFDALHAYGVVWDVYLTQLAFAVFVVAVTVALRRQSSRTETELAAYRGRLEALVDERMHDLEDAHERLAEESQRRLAAAAALRRRVADLDGLQRISRILADRSDLDEALREVAPSVASFLEADDVRVALTSATADAVGEPAGDLSGPRLVAADGVLVVPLVARGHTLGALHVSRAAGEPFSPHERGLAQTVADDIAAAVENEVLHAQQTRAATEEERQRLARELHDAVAQTVYSAALIAEALPTVWERDEAEGRANLARLQRLTRAALAETRALLVELRPAALEAAPLESLLERLGDAVAGQFSGEVTVDAAEGIDLPPEVKLAFYRVAQEAFANVVKHAQAGAVHLVLREARDGAVILTVSDDGRGFDPHAVRATSMGVRMMHERMESLGAALVLDTRPGKGTTITAVWPHAAAGRPAQETM
jgi:signal transduction histidine kinase